MGTQVRRALNGPVVIDGPSFIGRRTKLTLRPYNRPGIFFRLSDNTIGSLNEAILDVSRLHFLTLTWHMENGRDAILRIPEHLLGMIYAINLDAIIIEAEPFCLPHDGTAEIYWRKLKANLIDNGTMPIVVTTDNVGLKKNGSELSYFRADGLETFKFSITVDYPGYGRYILEGILDEYIWEELFRARGRWSHWTHRVVAKGVSTLFRWPHRDACLWTSQYDTPDVREKILRELCFHRLLDFLGAMLARVPAGHRFLGTLHTGPKIGHKADLALLEMIESVLPPTN